MKTIIQFGLIIFSLIFVRLIPAQPQAPIDWSPIRLLMCADTLYSRQPIFSHGDTIVLTAIYGIEQTSIEDSAAVCVSADNGVTWSPWHKFPYTGWFTPGTIQVAFTSFGILCCTSTNDEDRSFYRTTDLGYTWAHRGNHNGNLNIQGVRGDTVLCDGRNRGSITWTTNGGMTFAPEREIDMPNGGIESMALSEGVIHVVGRRAPQYPLRAAYSRGPFLSGAFTEPAWVNSVYFAAVTQTAFDEQGVGVVATLSNYTGPIPRPTAVLVNTTRDNGLTWSVADTFTANESADFFTLMLVQEGSLWAVVWSDSTIYPGFIRPGKYFRFSANRTRSWYPSSQITGDSVGGGASTYLDICGSRIRLYAGYNWWNGQYGNNYFQWEGIIRRDSLAPMFTMADTVSSMLPIDSAISFACIATDNDSLWRMDVVLRKSGQSDSVVIPLIRDGANTYLANWSTPADTADWSYYYRAEDMWENVSYNPPDGPASPWTFHVGPLSISDPSIQLPLSFGIAVFPNPFNTSTQISFTLPITSRVTLRLFDVLGREVVMLMDEIQSAGEHQAHIDGSGLASGVYLCRMKAGAFQQTKKIVLIR